MILRKVFEKIEIGTLVKVKLQHCNELRFHNKPTKMIETISYSDILIYLGSKKVHKVYNATYFYFLNLERIKVLLFQTDDSENDWIVNEIK